jgi:uncharacterized iron-regulated protein
MRAVAVVVTLIVGLGGCAPKGPPAAAAEALVPVGGPWTAPFQAEHPLVGRIWDVAAGRFVDVDAMVADLRGADFVLLGEKHDNPDHHRLQALLVRELAPVAVGFEMLDVDDAVGEATSADELAEAAAWAESGWPAFDLYRPVFDATYGAGARVLAAHPTRAQVRQAMSEGIEALGAEVTEGLRLERPLTDEARGALADEIVASHCGHASPEIVDKMITAQVLKDAFMARSLAEAGGPAVLIAGGGHTRLDRGVPHYLDGTVRSVQLVEAVGGEEAPTAYDEGGSYLWFTPRVDEEDPCEKFRAQLEAMRHAAPSEPAPEEDAPEEPAPEEAAPAPEE